ncbi:MAG: amidotransferase 1, exosortase A system-associated [Woeseiaceae bacterium]|nr:amidotransferase 1, exosortase A system-associated [Woeseiaceae bacterium]
MCGFTGIVDLQGLREIDRGLLERMNDSQTHRGPDERGIHVSPGVGLGHRRLSIIDLSMGQQPLYNEDGSVVVVYNGEIYNHGELREELLHCGHQFRTHCDTEVIVHAWEEWGEDCVRRFNGMFSFALWDNNTSELLLARDRLGIKPLYYSVLPSGQVIFGTELKSLLEHPELPRRIDDHAVEEYFAFGYVPDPRTILRDASKLRPGHTIRFKRRGTPPSQREYWDVPFGESSVATFDESREEFVERLRAAVKRRLMSEVPLGAFLSGGVDSSAVVAMMSGLSDRPVNTCSISFGDPRYNESEFAQMVANRYSTNHSVEQVESDDYDLIDTLASFYDEPFADSSAIPTYRVCELARRHVTVALSGDGGDENFAGYRRYRWHAYEEMIRSRVPQGIRGPLFGMLGTVYPKLDWAPKFLRAKTTFQALARDSLAGFLDSVSVVSDHNRRRLFNQSFRDSLQGYNAVEVFRHYAEKSPTDHPLSLVQYLDLKTYLPGDILTKVDRASMAHSLEVRVPILDHTLTEWASTIKPEWKLKGREGKYLFKEAMRDYLPSDVLFREKMGFAVPLSSWFRGPLKERIAALATERGLADLGLFDMDAIGNMVRNHISGVSEHSAIIWSLVMFDASMKHLGITGKREH